MTSFKFQISKVTAPMRYASFYSALRDDLAFPERPRVLVFGCSTGEEIGTVYHFWPEAEVFACDIDQDVMAKARSSYREATIFFSSEEHLSRLPELDLICANSVFCRHPLPDTDIRTIMPFAEFDRYCTLLSSRLKEGGYLLMYNTNYFFQHADVSSHFSPVNVSRSWTAGFVPRLGLDGKVAAQPVLKGSVIQKYLVSSVEQVPSRIWLSSALFKKTDPGEQPVIEVFSGIGPLGSTPNLERPDLPQLTIQPLTYEPRDFATRASIDGTAYRLTQTYVSDFVARAWVLHGVSCDRIVK
jgi:SAM-dependent methyltransferase